MIKTQCIDKKEEEGKEDDKGLTKMSDVQQENKNTGSDLRGSQSNIRPPERQSSIKPPTSKKPVRTSAVIDLNPSKKSVKKSEKGS